MIDKAGLEALSALEKAAVPNGPISAAVTSDGGWEIIMPPVQKMRGPVSARLTGYLDQSQVEKLVAVWNAAPSLLALAREALAARAMSDAGVIFIWDGSSEGEERAQYFQLVAAHDAGEGKA